MLSRLCAAFLIVIVFGFGAFAAPKYDCPKNAQGNKHGGLGAKYWENGQFRLAEQETREAIKLSPDCSMWHQNLGFILESMDRYEDASQSWHKSLEVDKNWCTAYKTGSLMKLGLYYYERKRDFTNSIDFFEKALATAKKEEVDSKTLSSIYLYLSYNYTEPRERGNSYYNLETAETLKKKALVLSPNDLFIKASITKLLVLQNKLNEATQNISEIISAQEKTQNPNPGVYSYLAHIYSLLKDPIKSAFYIEKAIDLDHGQAQYLLKELDKDFRDVSSSKEMKRIIAKARELTKK
jgi:tetratricopeptide (TPR) repeat protein